MELQHCNPKVNEWIIKYAIYHGQWIYYHHITEKFAVYMSSLLV